MQLSSSVQAGGSRTRRRQLWRAPARKRPPTRQRAIEPLEDRHLLSFLAPVDYAVGSNPVAIATGYFNDDSVLDLAVANYSSNSVSVLLGNADGTFQTAQHFATGIAPQSLAVGDFNDDGNLDVVTANAGNYGVPASWDLSVLLGNGDGTLQAPQSIALPAVFPPGYTGATPLPQRPLSVAVGDLNEDGTLDLTATGTATFLTGPYYWCYYTCYPYYLTNTQGYANVLLGNDTGGFDTGEAHDLGAFRYPNAVTIADVNDDGDADVMTANGWDLSVLLGDGTGALGNPTHSGSGSGLRSISLGDVDGDGNVDTLLASGWGLAVQKGDGLGGFTAMPTLSTGSPVDSAVMGDVNDDGTLDLVAAGSVNEYHCSYWGYYGCYYGGYWTSTRQATVLLGNGLGNFSLPLTSNIGTESNLGWLPAARLEDLGGDGLPELITIDYYSSEAVVASNDGDWDAPPSIVISDAAVIEGDDGTVHAVFTVSIIGDHNGVSVDYATADSTALDGSDYSSTSGTLTFGVGETSMMVSVPVMGDAIDEYDEQFVVNLSNASGGQITDSQGIGTIEDDDDAPLLTITDVSKREGHKKHTTSFAFTVNLSGPSGKWVYVDFTTADGTATVADNDYFATGGTLYFAPGETSTTITVWVRGDRRKEADETFSVNLIGASEATIADGEAIGTILDDDTHGKGKGPKPPSEPAASVEPSPTLPSSKSNAAKAPALRQAPAEPAGLLPSELVDLALADFNPASLDPDLVDQLALAISGW